MFPDTSPLPKRPGAHRVQYKALGVLMCWPAGQSLHSSAFAFPENLPAGQSAQLSPLTKVPGLHVPQYPADDPPQFWRFPPLVQFWHALHPFCPTAS